MYQSIGAMDLFPNGEFPDVVWSFGLKMMFPMSSETAALRKARASSKRSASISFWREMRTPDLV